MPGHEPVARLGWAHVDADHVGDLPAPVLAGGAGAAPAAALAKQGEQLLLQLPAGIGIDGVVDGLVGHALAWVVGMHALQCAGNLLGRPAQEQKIAGGAPEAAMRMQLGSRTRCGAAGLAGSLSRQPGQAARHNHHQGCCCVPAPGTRCWGCAQASGRWIARSIPAWTSEASVRRSSGCKCVYREVICASYLRFWCCTSGLRPPRLSRDYERLPEVLGGLHFLVFAVLMLPAAARVLAAAGSS